MNVPRPAEKTADINGILEPPHARPLPAPWYRPPGQNSDLNNNRSKHDAHHRNNRKIDDHHDNRNNHRNNDRTNRSRRSRGIAVKRGLVVVAAVIAAVIALAFIAVTWLPARALVVAYTLPAYPDWPAPQAGLAVGDGGAIYFPTSSPYDLEVILTDAARARPATGLGYLSVPERASSDAPVPAMIILPGSGGIQAGREHEYARWFTARGIAAFVVEYYAPRGFDEDAGYRVRTAAVTEFDLIADAYAALTLLGSSPLIDAGRIGLIGFSYGGMAARLAMDQRIRDALAPDVPPFDLHIDVYGPCYQDLQSPAVTGAPLLTLRGTEDASNDLAACARREAELRALGANVTARVYEGAGHAWEVEKQRRLSEESPYLSGCEVRYDERGRPFLNGTPLNDYAADASYATRVAARFSSSLRFKDCADYGYIIGRDDDTRARADADIAQFLATRWQGPAPDR